jgi:hypothetical protein
MSDVIGTGTAEGLKHFLRRAGKRGDMAQGTARAQEIAVVKVLEIEPDPGNVDIRTLDVKDVLERFVRLKGMNYTPDSLETYQSRFRTAVRHYLSYLDDPVNFRFRKVRVVRKKPNAERETSQAATSSTTGATIAPPYGDDMVTPAAPDALVRYPFPLKMGGIAYLQVPRQITRGDVERLAGFLNSLVIEDDAHVNSSNPGTAES